MRKFFKLLTVFFAVSIFMIFVSGIFVSSITANEYTIVNNNDLVVMKNLPVKLKPCNKNGIKVVSTNNLNSECKASINLMNVIPVKTVNVKISDEVKVTPCGTPFGVKMFTQGVVVVGTSDVKCSKGTVNPAKEAGIKVGDIILNINGKEVNTNEDVSNLINQSGGNPLVISIRRCNVDFDVRIVPVVSDSGDGFKAGIWVRDSSAGIGTLTFYEQESNLFAGLGHGICDTDTGEIMPLLSGDIVSANINGITKSQKGSPGELKGYFNDDVAIGTLLTNNQTGVYGKLNSSPVNNEPITVAMKQQVLMGNAKILTTIDGCTPESYDIEILNINYDEQSPTKNMIIKITDERLLEKTGGIVQGMSGSPIIQNGMLVGAVTHVFVNDPEKGYAIFAENMVQSTNKIANSCEMLQNLAS